MEGGGGGEKRERLPASPTILENAPLYFTVRLICKLTARQNRSMTNRLPLDYQICKITLFSIRTRSRRLEKLYSFFFCSRQTREETLAMQARSLREEFLLGSWTAGSWEFFWILRDWWPSEHATAAVKPYSSTLQFLVVCVKKLLLIVNLRYCSYWWLLRSFLKRSLSVFTPLVFGVAHRVIDSFLIVQKCKPLFVGLSSLHA